ncbi:uncharacterized protein Eint_041640 [Encephalitozoon intestinalis ATCC 50506]|uniref:Uncharacterized protein n=1 Tax=Encephalitozoon intestinalis (strain ATCC 50506) TaxID=876142 RepID=E0S6W6_ENCIT|nr:uncharacterized protein Eint_041640 [Encephalitozoon intestinalis ATCC 50506]ADM11451.2 hypothetical protein Eint_041640 [Encephalitozoon intestinalis ATCC 50506]UTX45148.1 hypothetical protein GPK93_04g06880 [Encephalitozoon intestinalis]
MATNINCKKKWHPSRYETQIRVKEAEQAIEKNKTQENTRKELGRRETLEFEVQKEKAERMQWML